MQNRVQIHPLQDRGDVRGYSFTAPVEALEFVGAVRDVHFSSMVPGAVRGNHYHLRRREAIVVLYQGDWSFHWDEGEGGERKRASFQGQGAQLILVSPSASHAVRNDGNQELRLIAFSSEAYDPAETVARKVV
jgi:oxalate decarboxylase/phosphoglucose isomerase-like protein (cupin superfamily)